MNFFKSPKIYSSHISDRKLKTSAGTMTQLADLLPLSIGIPSGCQFMSWLLHFSSSSGLWSGELHRMAQVLVPCILVGDPEEATGLWLQIGTTLAIVPIGE